VNRDDATEILAIDIEISHSRTRVRVVHLDFSISHITEMNTRVNLRNDASQILVIDRDFSSSRSRLKEAHARTHLRISPRLRWDS